jgi:hypothetical protein
MRFAVIPMRRLGARLEDREALERRPIVGDLRVEYAQDTELKRPVRTARLLRYDRSIDADALPPLYDAVLVGMSSGGFSLTGFERAEGRCFAQSWLVREA